jgi:hypothetical protein
MQQHAGHLPARAAHTDAVSFLVFRQVSGQGRDGALGLAREEHRLEPGQVCTEGESRKVRASHLTTLYAGRLSMLEVSSNESGTA